MAADTGVESAGWGVRPQGRRLAVLLCLQVPVGSVSRLMYELISV